jgi:hypothetical protein
MVGETWGASMRALVGLKPIGKRADRQAAIVAITAIRLEMKKIRKSLAQSLLRILPLERPMRGTTVA